MKALFQFAIIISLFLSACTTIENNEKSEGLSSNDMAQWIGDRLEQPTSDSLFYLDNPAPLFRKEFKTEKNIESATLYITAAGYYKASVNGNRVGDILLDPAWTDFSKRIYYSEYDITSLLQDGDNCVGVTLGNGFYNPLPMKMWGGRNIRHDLPVGRPTFIASLKIKYDDGKSEEIVSDLSWKYSYGPLVKNNVYLGEIYDASREIKGWDKVGFNDNSWKSAITGTNPGGDLQEAFFPPIQQTQKLKPIDIYSLKEDTYTVDMGVNFTGTYKIKLSGNKGDTISFRFGERVYEDGSVNPMTTVCGQIKRAGVGGPGSPAIAEQTDSYIIGDESPVWYQPEFTFHTYRYMEVSGLKTKPLASEIEGVFLHTNVAKNSTFSSSSELLNSIQDAVERTFMANLISVQSDCPAREKFGYGGDLNATSEAFIYNYDMHTIYKKTIYDWVDAIRDSTFIDTAPFVGIKYCGLSWESAYLTTQYYLYLYYNDTDIVKELYDFNKKWMEKAAMIHPDGIVDSGLSDHESLEKVPVQLTGTSHYMQCAEIMQEFATVMGDKENALKYGKLAEKLRDWVKSEYWDKTVEGPINRQTLFSNLLYHDIVPENEIPAAKDSLLNAVKNGIAGHFTTGIFGTKYVLETMSEYTSTQNVFDIVNSTTYPGWGHMIDNGATTIWETWKESDNTFSNCHPMFGMVTEWFYRWLGGIRPDADHPGFKEFTLAPNTPEGLQYSNCSYQSPHGKIVSNWKKDKGVTTFEVMIPEGTTANVTLPVGESSKIKIDKDGKVKDMESGTFELKSGEYVITVN